MARRAAGRIPLARAQNVLVDVSVVDMMQVSVVKIVLGPSCSMVVCPQSDRC